MSQMFYSIHKFSDFLSNIIVLCIVKTWSKEKEMLKCLLHQLAPQMIFKYPYQDSLKNNMCVKQWTLQDLKGCPLQNCLTALQHQEFQKLEHMPRISSFFLGEGSQMECSKGNAVCRPYGVLGLGAEILLHTLLLLKHMQFVPGGRDVNTQGGDGCN